MIAPFVSRLLSIFEKNKVPGLAYALITKTADLSLERSITVGRRSSLSKASGIDPDKYKEAAP
jgi:hypothetical protein